MQEYINQTNTEVTTGENTDRQDYEDFLKDMFMEDEPESVGTKDTFDDNFDNWLHELDSEEWIKYANRYGQSMRATGQKEIVGAAKLTDLK